MIPIYAFMADSDRYAPLECVVEEDLDRFIDGFDTEHMASDWVAPRVRVLESFAGPTAPPGDFTNLFGAVPIVNRRAVDAFAGVLEWHGELLPLSGGSGPYWAYNVTTTVDLLDEAESTGDWFEPGRLMDLTRLVARQPAPSELPPIFKLPQWRKGAPLLTEAFIETVRENHLTGLNPRRIGGA